MIDCVVVWTLICTQGAQPFDWCVPSFRFNSEMTFPMRPCLLLFLLGLGIYMITVAVHRGCVDFEPGENARKR
jgi:hypothetical protein